MRISIERNLSFQRKLRPDEEADFSAILKRGKEKLGNTGHSILIVPSSSLPQTAKTNTGAGNLLDSEAIKFVDFAKQYWGINTVQLLPEGRFKNPHRGVYKPYSGSAFDLGNQVINLELLTKKDFGEILTKEDFNKVVQANTNSSDCINFENIQDNDSETEKALKKAFQNLKKADTEKKKEILKEFDEYRKINRSWLEPKSVYAALAEKYQSWDYKKWETAARCLYDTDYMPLEQRQSEIESIMKSQFGESGRFFEFKQFMADTHLNIAKENLNKKGLELCGDVLIGFSAMEKWANPKAFIPEASVGWGLPALNFETEEGISVLKQKFKLFAKRYDKLRIDASWLYATQRVEVKRLGQKYKKEYGSKLLDIIDETVKSVKGADFDLKNIMHEFVADPSDFTLYQSGWLKPSVKDRVKIYTSGNLSQIWGTTTGFERLGWERDSYVLGATNHDSCSIRAEYKSLSKRRMQIPVLSNILKIPAKELETFQGYSQAKFAEPMRAKNNMFFFTDALNLLNEYKGYADETKNYRIRIGNDYQEKFFKSLEKGEGFNIMDALEKAFIAEGLDKKEPELFEKIVKYRKILQGKEDEIKQKVKSSSGKSGWKAVLVYIGIISLSAIAGYYLLSNKNGNSLRVPEKKEL